MEKKSTGVVEHMQTRCFSRYCQPGLRKNFDTTKREGERVNNERRERYANDPNYREKRKEQFSSYNKKRMSIEPVTSKEECFKRLDEIQKESAPAIGEKDFSSLEVRYILGIGHNEFYKLVKNKSLVATMVNRNYRIKESDLLAYMNNVLFPSV